MIVSAAQPYFCPYPGYFARAAASDIFVVLDTVQFPRGSTWITRNRFKNDQGALWLGIPVMKKGLGLQRINDVKIYTQGRRQKKLLESIAQAYRHSPYLEDHFDFIKELFSSDHDKILPMNMQGIVYIMSFLHAKTKIVLLSDLGIEESGSRLIVEICKALSATRYLAPASICNHLDEKLFLKENIDLASFKAPILVYPQLWGNFIPNLSIFDLILNCGPKAEEMIKKKCSVSDIQVSR
jgi:hypothetical protein